MTKATEKTNHAYCQETLALRKEIETWFLSVGERLHSIREEQLYKPFWDSFEEYEMEFKWSPGTVSKLINIYSKFILEYEIAPAKLVEAGGWTILAETLPVVHSKEDAEKWVEQATTQSRADLREAVKAAQGKISKEDSCKHKDTYLIRICRDCGLREEVHNH